MTLMRRITFGLIIVAVLALWTVHLSKGEPLQPPPDFASTHLVFVRP